MLIKKIQLKNFRNYTNKEFDFDPSITLIQGNNGVGKTNILEALYLLSIGKSCRAVTEKDMINIDGEIAFTTGFFDDDTKLEVVIAKSLTARAKKIYKKNNTVKRAKDFVGIFKSVLFNPEDIRLIIGSPLRRREYLDVLLSQAYPEYYKNLNKYQRVLKYRNKLLEQKAPSLYAQIEVWDNQLIETGIVIQKYRREFFDFAKKHIQEISHELFGNNYELEIIYHNVLINKESLFFYLKKDMNTGHTSIGPHRDDFDFMLRNTGHTLDLQNYGSRGQQRTAVLAMKIIELKYIEDITGVKPTLLLDDIFSELDDNFRDHIVKVMAKYQTIVTSAEHLDNLGDNSGDSSGSDLFHNFVIIDL